MITMNEVTLGDQLHPMKQTLFPKGDAIFQDTVVNIKSWFKEHEGEVKYLPLPVQSPDLNTCIIKPLWSSIKHNKYF